MLYKWQDKQMKEQQLPVCTIEATDNVGDLLPLPFTVKTTPG